MSSSPPTKILRSAAASPVPSSRTPDKNVVEQVKETGDEVERAESKIKQVQQKIEQVEHQITQVEEKLDQSQNDWETDEDLRDSYDGIEEYRSWLRDEEKYLVSKEKYLQSDKRYLLQQKERLREAKIRKHIFLGQGSTEASPETQRFFTALQSIAVDGNGFLTLPAGTSWLGQYKGDLPMYVRSCYTKMYDILQDNLGMERKLIVTGTPGIGKSCFGLYWLFRSVQDGKNVIYEYGTREDRRCYLWTSEKLLIKVNRQGPSAFYRSYLNKADTVQLVDSRGDPFIGDACQTIVFSCPREENFHDFLKHGARMFYMPLWSASELEYCRGKIYSELPEACMNAAVGAFGRVPRYVLGFAASEVAGGEWCEKAALKGEVPDILLNRVKVPLYRMDESRMRRLLAMPRLGISHKLVHAHVDDQDYEEPIYVLASPYVREFLERRFSNIINVRAREVLLAGEDSFEFCMFRGLMFESVARRALRSGLGNVRARVLADDSDCPRYEILPFSVNDITKTAVFSPVEYKNPLEPNTYYQSEARPYPSIESFLIVDRTLYLIQVSITPLHNIKMAEVQRLVEKAKCKRTLLVFVTMGHRAGSFPRQTFIETRGERIRRLGKGLESITQVVLGVDVRDAICKYVTNWT